jgi:hypothetical protein
MMGLDYLKASFPELRAKLPSCSFPYFDRCQYPPRRIQIPRCGVILLDLLVFGHKDISSNHKSLIRSGDDFYSGPGVLVVLNVATSSTKSVEPSDNFRM